MTAADVFNFCSLLILERKEEEPYVLNGVLTFRVLTFALFIILF